MAALRTPRLPSVRKTRPGVSAAPRGHATCSQQADWAPRETISRLDAPGDPLQTGLLEVSRPPLPESRARRRTPALTIASQPGGIPSCRQVQTSRPRRAEHRRRLRALSNRQRARPAPGRAARAAAPARNAVAATAASSPRRGSVLLVQHRHASRAGAAHEPALAALRHQVILLGSVHDWPALSAGFACQWHGTKCAQRLEDPGRIGALSKVLRVFSEGAHAHTLSPCHFAPRGAFITHAPNK